MKTYNTYICIKEGDSWICEDGSDYFFALGDLIRTIDSNDQDVLLLDGRIARECDLKDWGDCWKKQEILLSNTEILEQAIARKNK